MVALPGWSTGPLAQNTTCMLRIENGRMPFTVMLQLEGLAFPHHVGLLCELVFFLCLPAPKHCQHAAAALQPSPE